MVKLVSHLDFLVFIYVLLEKFNSLIALIGVLSKLDSLFGFRMVRVIVLLLQT
jgi:hypothetical protein